MVAACGASERSEPAAQLVPQLSDLPPGYNLNSAESFPVPTSRILADPWSAGIRQTIKRERISGYQASFVSPVSQRIECSAALYRSAPAAAEVFTFRMGRFAEFVATSGGGPVRVQGLGGETHAYRYNLGSQPGLLVTWRARRVLSLCGTVSGDPPSLADVLVVARAQQRRIANFRR
jgi:hypothetical protein